MVDRCKINEKGCIIVDLDGTLLSGNSLKFLTKFLFKILIKKHQIGEIIKLSHLIIVRKTKFIPHKKMKYNIIQSANLFLNKQDIENFAKILYENRNRKVEDLLKSYKTFGNTILIATAAPDFYLESFVKLFDTLDMKHIGSKLTSAYENFIENKGVEKLRTVESYLKENNLNCIGVITDHEDDLPLLIKYPSNTFLIEPKKKTLRQIKKFRHIHYKIID